MSAQSRYSPAFLLLCVGYLTSTAAMYVVNAQAAGHRALGYIVAHFVLTALSVALALRAPEMSSHEARALSVTAVLARVALIACPAFTSTDVTRYLWDGAVILQGLDPYALAPDAPALRALATHWPSPQDHRDVVSCYPPAAQWLFALCALAGPTLAFYAWKSLLAALSSVAALVALHRAQGAAAKRAAVLFALSPLVVLEGGVGAHLDIAVMACMVIGLRAIEQQKTWSAGALFGLAAALKLTPVLACVALWRAMRWSVRWVLACALAPTVTIGSALWLHAALPGSLPLVAKHWSFASPLWTALYTRWPLSDGIIRPALTAAALVIVLAQWLRPRASADVLARDALLGHALTSPTLYPWYIAPIVACTSSRFSAFVFALAAVAPCTYEVIDGYQRAQLWHPARWPMVLIALIPPAAALSYGLVARAREATRESSTRPL
ncbi:MAG: glycosyltransferase 87 family protein [Deltaproteobacteria bacterium]|nr:glycosyltransferase 87 family protein [Deltaproteobacteria bacterium]